MYRLMNFQKKMYKFVYLKRNIFVVNVNVSVVERKKKNISLPHISIIFLYQAPPMGCSSSLGQLQACLDFKYIKHIIKCQAIGSKSRIRLLKLNDYLPLEWTLGKVEWWVSSKGKFKIWSFISNSTRITTIQKDRQTS